MRRTHALIRVALVLMANPNDRQWGYQLSRDSSVRSGTLYPILTRMLDDGWVTAGWEPADDVELGRPRRRYYKLTDLGCRELGGLLADARTEARFAPVMLDARWSM